MNEIQARMYYGENKVDIPNPQREVIAAECVGTMEIAKDLKRAAEYLASGDPIAFQIFGVYGLAADAANPDAVNKVHEIKATPPEKDRVLTLMTDSGNLKDIVDIDAIHPRIRHLFESNYNRLQRRIGALCHLRLPVLQEARESGLLPGSLISEEDGLPLVQNLDPIGHWWMQTLIREAQEKGISHVAVTSLNKSRVMPEIADADTALKFTEENDIPILLTDPMYQQHSVKGSFSIIGANNLRAHREGNVPIHILNRLLDLHELPEDQQIYTEGMKSAKYDQADFSCLHEYVDPDHIRIAILNYFQGGELAAGSNDHSLFNIKLPANSFTNS